MQKPTFQEIVKEIEKYDYYPQGGEAKLVYTLPPHQAILGMKDIVGINCPFSVFYLKNSYFSVFWYRTGMKKITRHILKKQENNHNFVDNLEKIWNVKVNELKNSVTKLTHLNLKKLELEKLVELFKEICKKGNGQWNHFLFLDSFDPEGEELLDRELKKTDNSLIKIKKTLIFPDHLSYTQREEISLLKIAKFMGEEKLTDSVLEINNFDGFPKKVVKLIEKHQQNFYWYKNNYAHIIYLDNDFFLQKIKKIISLNTSKQIKEKIIKIENSFKEEIKKRNKFVKELPEKTQNLLYFFRRMTELRDKRKENQCIMVAGMKLLLEQIAERINLDINLVENIADWEADEFLGDKIKLKEKLMAREEVVSIAHEKAGMLLFTGKEAEKIHAILEEKIMKTEQELTGRPASMGKAKGIVRIINKVEDFNKFKKGEILVTSMTRPEFVPIMEKAAAIVTDEGGITCHAAIVSREFGIPCIVGTEIATKVLKNGDVVEIDANEGIVKKFR